MTRPLRRLLIAVVVLLGLLVGADRVSLLIAEGVAARAIQQSEHLEATPSVSVPGFPFLTQLISGHYNEIDLAAKGVEVGSSIRELRVASVNVVLHDVHVKDDFKVVRSSSATATALITYADLSKTLAATVLYAGHGRLEATAGVKVLGVDLRGSISARPVLTNAHELSFQDTTISALGQQAPPALDSLLGGIFATPIPLAALPFGLTFTGLSITSAGIAVAFTGRNLLYDGS
jgi:hypothetical protein